MDGQRKLEKKDRSMTPEQLKAWREQLFGTGYGTRSKQTAAEALGLSQRAYDSYEAGEHRIPRYIKLACMALKEGLEAEDFLVNNAIDINKYEAEIYDIIRRTQKTLRR
jgi:transcriptional regulator with XRE-family HTH domain